MNLFDVNTRLVKPTYESPVTDLIIELEKLRTRILGGTTNPYVFFQMKEIFHTLESIGSARIEGNNTTITDYLETKYDGGGKNNTERKEGVKEIANIESAISFIESYIKDSKIDRPFLSELHKLVVSDLNYLPGGEGDKTPGLFRLGNVAIKKSKHKPIDFLRIDEFMDELFDFINKDDLPKYDLLKIAIVHHRFLWIHPFTNGNGRTARLITYAMLVKYGFNVNAGRILNPTAVFCNSRGDYYDNLAKADTQTDDGILDWCQYVLNGLKIEIEKVDKLADYTYLKTQILIPAVEYAVKNSSIREIEGKIIKVVIEKQEIMANDLKGLFYNKSNPEISRQIKMLTDKNMLEPIEIKARKYRLRVLNKHLLPAVFHMLDENGFLPEKNESKQIKELLAP
jgi:Fic family protein